MDFIQQIKQMFRRMPFNVVEWAGLTCLVR